jgi:ACS family D-galactonate transporter-like MFS transporter
LGLAIFINFVDRGNLSIAAPLVKDELHLSASQLGILLSSFFWTYSLFAVPAGLIVDRVDPGWALALGFLLWSCATSVTGLVHGFAALLALRLILGMVEAVAFPAYSTILARNFQEHQRGVANIFGSVGQGAGPAAATFLGGLMIGRFGWRPFFVVLGVGSLLWLIPWLRWMPRAAPNTLARPPLTWAAVVEVARHRSLWGMTVEYFCGNDVVYLLLTWLPFYLIRERHFSLSAAAKIGGATFLLKAVGGITSGWVSDVWISRGATPTLVRKTMLCAALLTCAVMMLAVPVAADRSSVICLLAGTLALGFVTPQGHAMNQTLAGPVRAGTWVSILLLVSNFSGIVGPTVTGFVLERTGKFFWAFALMSAMACAGAACVIFVVGRIEPLVWTSEASSSGSAAAMLAE